VGPATTQWITLSELFLVSLGLAETLLTRQSDVMVRMTYRRMPQSSGRHLLIPWRQRVPGRRFEAHTVGVGCLSATIAD